MTEEQQRRYPLSAYTVGSITKIVLTDFLTYDQACYLPSPNLNVIIGFNGTGKSSVLCGICLAVGGSPTYLGRSSRLSDYIKHGKSSGWVEVTLRSDCESGIKRLKITLRKPGEGERGSDCITEYFIDDEKVTHKHLNEVVEKFNIQIANPCTFLAQDKVKSFSEQDSQELLENTQSALGGGLIDKYTELVAESKESIAVENKKRTLETNLERWTKMISELEPRVQAYLNRKDTNMLIKKLKKCIAYLEAEAAFEKFKAEIAIKISKQEELRTKQSKTEQIQAKITKCEAKAERSRVGFRTHLTKINEVEDEILALSRERKLDDEIADNQRHFDATKHRFDTWESEKKAVEANVASFRNNYTEAASNYTPRDLTTERAAVFKEGETLQRLKQLFRQNQSSVKWKEQDLSARKEAHRKAMSNKLQQISNLRPLRHLNISQAWDFYQANRDKFRFPVHVPYVEMVLKDKSAPLFLSNTIGPRDLAIFIFGCAEDERLMHTQGFKLNTTVMDERRIGQYSNRRPELSDAIKQLGFKKFLYQMIDAPVEVLAYLMANNNIDSIPIGSSALNNDIEDVASRIGRKHGLFYTPEFRCQVKFSQFTGDPIVRIEHINDKNNCFTDEHYLPFNPDYAPLVEEIQKEIQSLTDHEKEINERIKAYTTHNAELQEATKEDQRRKWEIGNLKVQLEREDAKLKDLLEGRPDLENAQSALEERNARCKQRALNTVEKYINAAESLNSQLANLAEHALNVAYCDQIVDEETKKETQLQSEIDVLQDELNKLAREFSRVERGFQLCNERFADTCRLPSIDPSKLNSREKRQLQELSEVFERDEIERDINILEGKIDQEIARLNVAGVSGTEADVERHRSVLSEKAEGQKDLAIIQQQMEINTAQLAAHLNSWRDPVNELIAKISANFSSFFTQLGCMGEVKLSVPENEYHLEKYGIDIYVKFRENTALRRLDDKSQSGGERSVSTMLYMLALQELCPVPFRCVDEINQGMDPINERKVFEIMLNILASEGSLANTQYFLLTPKLLPGLKYNEKVRVGIIFNSPTVITDREYKESMADMMAGVALDSDDDEEDEDETTEI